MGPRHFTLPIVALLVTFILPAVAWAHVSLRPAESEPGASVTYTVRVPSEGSVATTSIELEIPDNVVIQSIDGAPESFAVKKVGARASSITWKQVIPAGQNAEFKFTAQNPAIGNEIVWKAHQVFEDGTRADWVEPKGSKRPSPVTVLKKPQ